MSNQNTVSDKLHFDDREHARSVYQLAHQWHPKALKAQWVLLLTWLSMYASAPWAVPGLIDFLGPLGGIVTNVSDVYGELVGLWSNSAWPEWAQLTLSASLAVVVFGSAFLSAASLLVLIGSTLAEWAVVNDDLREGGEMPTEKFMSFVNGHVAKYRVETSFLSAAPTILTFASTGSFAMTTLVLVATLHSVSVQRDALSDIQARAEVPC